MMLEYGLTLVSNDTVVHDTIPYLCGSTDFLMEVVKIAELKCYQPKKFCLYTDAILTQDIEFIKLNFPQEYWQAVSNAILNKVPNAELISYMPYQSELTEIREMADNYDGPEEIWKVRFIVESPDSGLAYLPDGGYYKNLNRFEFKVPDVSNLLILLLEKFPFLSVFNDIKLIYWIDWVTNKSLFTSLREYAFSMASMVVLLSFRATTAPAHLLLVGVSSGSIGCVALIRKASTISPNALTDCEYTIIFFPFQCWEIGRASCRERV